jgi:hypothetical protein
MLDHVTYVLYRPLDFVFYWQAYSICNKHGEKNICSSVSETLLEEPEYDLYSSKCVCVCVCVCVVYHLRNISTGCTYGFRMTVTKTLPSIVITLLGLMWFINVSENKKISSNGLILTAKRPTSYVTDYTFCCLAVRVSLNWVPSQCGLLYQNVMTILAQW